jgi:hypothetical protein
MNRRFATALAMAIFATALTVVAGDTGWIGYIADSKCGAKAANDGARECTIKCVKAGARYVFVSDGDKKIYAIDDQSKVAEHAGHHVIVKGALAGDTLKLTSVEVAASSK